MDIKEEPLCSKLEMVQVKPNFKVEIKLEPPDNDLGTTLTENHDVASNFEIEIKDEPLDYNFGTTLTEDNEMPSNFEIEIKVEPQDYELRTTLIEDNKMPSNYKRSIEKRKSSSIMTTDDVEMEMTTPNREPIPSGTYGSGKHGYMKKYKLSSVGTTLQFIKTSDLYSAQNKNHNPEVPTDDEQSFLEILIAYSKAVGDTSNTLMQIFQNPTNIEKLSIHCMVCMHQGNPANAEEFLKFCSFNMKSINCSEARIATVNQNDCSLWQELHYARITASKAYEAVHCKTLNGTLTEDIMGESKLRNAMSMKRINLVIKFVEKIKQIKIHKCCFMLNANHPIMGASPDGISDEYVIKVKCLSPDKALMSYVSTSNKICCKYMVQIQLQMHFFNKIKALFCLASSDFESTKNVSIIEVDYDEDFCKDIITKCTLFWSKAIFPLLFN